MLNTLGDAFACSLRGELLLSKVNSQGRVEVPRDKHPWRQPVAGLLVNRAGRISLSTQTTDELAERNQPYRTFGRILAN